MPTFGLNLSSEFFSMNFRHFHIISPLENVCLFVCTNLNSSYQKMLCVMLVGIASVILETKIKMRKDYRRMDGQTDDELYPI